jgi:hypothetical protein
LGREVNGIFTSYFFYVGEESPSADFRKLDEFYGYWEEAVKRKLPKLPAE